MLELGPVSSLFDIATFVVLFFVVCPATVGASWAELAAAGNVAGMAAFAATKLMLQIYKNNLNKRI